MSSHDYESDEPMALPQRVLRLFETVVREGRTIRFYEFKKPPNTNEQLDLLAKEIHALSERLDRLNRLGL